MNLRRRVVAAGATGLLVEIRKREVWMIKDAVAAGATGLLVELRKSEVEMIQDDVAHVGEIDPLPERGCRHDDAKRAVAKEVLDEAPLGSGHPRMVEGDGRAEAP